MTAVAMDTAKDMVIKTKINSLQLANAVHIRGQLCFLYQKLNYFTNSKNVDYLSYVCNLLIYNIMQQGTVKFFNDEKGFGFITPANGGSEIFVHSSGLIDNIRENNSVSYDVEEGRKGPNAVNVKIV